MSHVTHSRLIAATWVQKVCTHMLSGLLNRVETLSLFLVGELDPGHLYKALVVISARIATEPLQPLLAKTRFILFYGLSAVLAIEQYALINNSP